VVRFFCVITAIAEGTRKRISSIEVERTIGEQFATDLARVEGRESGLFCI
jgi:hypothetical protein